MALREETRARARALQALYAWETDGRPPIDQLLPRLDRLTGDPPPVRERARRLTMEVAARCTELDDIVGRAAEHWRLDRLALVDRNILRIAVCELEDGATPPRVVIDQALWLAHRFASPQSPAFVNGVLDQVARAMGRL